MKTVKITDPRKIEIIKKIVEDKKYIHTKIREGKIHEISAERPDIKFKVW